MDSHTDGIATDLKKGTMNRGAKNKPVTYEETSKQIAKGFDHLCRAALAGDNDACFAFRNLTACLRDAGVLRALNLTADDLPARPVPTLPIDEEQE